MKPLLTLAVLVALAVALHRWPAEAGVGLGIGLLAGCLWMWSQRGEWPR